MRLSVLDVSPIPPGGTAADAYRNTVELARAAEEAGYLRYWVAEHHGLGQAVAGVVPEALITRIASMTTSIRVGAGAVLLNYAQPMRVAETYRAITAMFGDRIDLGIGRAPAMPVVDATLCPPVVDPFGDFGDMPGADQLRAMQALADHEDKVSETLAWLGDGFAPDDPRATVTLVAGDQTVRPQPWLVGSSLASGLLAGRLGLPFAYAAFFNPAEATASLRAYRASFTPSSSSIDDAPYAVLAVNACCAATEEEADRLRASVEWFYADGGDVDRQPLASPEEAINALGGVPASVTLDGPVPPAHFSGAPERLATMLQRFAGLCGADELMVQDLIADQAARVSSVRLLADAFSSLPVFALSTA